MGVKPIINILPSQNKQNYVNTVKNKQPNYVKLTGYGAVATMATSVLAASNKKYKLHKYFAIFSGVLALLHVGIVESYRLKKSNN